jgi:predicted nuclease with TOPRIM domain
MFHNYDPFEELETAKHNISQLIKAYNDHNATIQEILKQNRQLNNMLRLEREEIARLKSQVDQLSRY